MYPILHAVHSRKGIYAILQSKSQQCDCLYHIGSPATPRPGEHSSPARSAVPSLESACSNTALSSYTPGSLWHTEAYWWENPAIKKAID